MIFLELIHLLIKKHEFRQKEDEQNEALRGKRSQKEMMKVL